jgi:hypothetical protein
VDDTRGRQGLLARFTSRRRNQIAHRLH